MKTKTGYAVACIAIAGAMAGCGGGSESEAADLPTPKLGETFDLGGAPGAVAVADGSVWVTDSAAGTVARLRPDGKLEGRPIEIEGGPTSITASEDSVWVASGTGLISRIDAASGKAAPVAELSPQPGGLAADLDSVWVTHPADDRVSRIDATTGDTLDEFDVGDLPTDVVLAGGSAWVANVDDGTVSRIEVESGEVSEPISVASGQALALAADETGVWVAATDDARVEGVEVSRIDTASGEPDNASASLDTGIPVRLAIGEGGIWAMLAGPALNGEGSVALIDPATSKASGEALEVGAQPRSIATGGGYVWVTDAEGTLTRIDAGG
jgi:DNA-binding beta-propeller fold protein YncE